MNSATCTLFNLQRFSTEDGPGIRTTLFFKGCPLRCPWCHNPEGLRPGPEVMWQSLTCLGCGDCAEACPQTAIHLDDSRVHVDRRRCKSCGRCVQACPSGARELAGTEYTVDALLDEVLKDRTFYATSGGGVTFSGGEPMMQLDFLIALAKECKNRDFHTALDTSGYARWENYLKVIDFIDLILYDMKHMDPERHKEFTGVDNKLILANAKRLDEHDKTMWIRVPVVPDCNDTVENMQAAADHFKGFQHIERVELLPYHRLAESKYRRLHQHYSLEGTETPVEEHLKGLAKPFEDAGLNVKIG